MFQPRPPLDRTASPPEIETPIFHALRDAQTPIFRALVTGPFRSRHENPSEDDPMAQFRRDPLTAPIPVQALTEAWTPPAPRPEHARRGGRHRLVSSALA